MVEAWKRRSSLIHPVVLAGPTTRMRAKGNLPLRDMRGHSGKLISHKIVAYWNALPMHIKLEDNRKKAVKAIMSSLM